MRSALRTGGMCKSRRANRPPSPADRDVSTRRRVGVRSAALRPSVTCFMSSTLVRHPHSPLDGTASRAAARCRKSRSPSGRPPRLSPYLWPDRGQLRHGEPEQSPNSLKAVHGEGSQVVERQVQTCPDCDLQDVSARPQAQLRLSPKRDARTSRSACRTSRPACPKRADDARAACRGPSR